MRRLASIAVLLLVLSVWPRQTSRSTFSEQRARPNFIFIYADDLGYGDLGSYGHPTLKTPNLDQLAAEGSLFTQFYLSHNSCSPTRASFITGQYPSRYRIFRPLGDFNSNAKLGVPNWLDLAAPSLPRALQEAGYRTAMFGKWHLGGGSGSQTTDYEKMDAMKEGPRPRPQSPAYINDPDAPPVTAYGFDIARTAWGNSPTWYNAQPYPEPHQVYPYNDKGWVTWSSRAIVDSAIEFLSDQSSNHKDQRFLMNVWLSDPHRPLKPTAEMRKPYQSIPEPFQSYYASVTFMDQELGRLLRQLKLLGLEKDTLVIFSSDNGPVAGLGGSAGGLRGWKFYLYEGGIRVPFIVRWPGHIPAGRRDTTSVLNIVDLAPTLCSLAGTSMPKGYQPDGVDITAALMGRPFKRTKPMFWHAPVSKAYSPILAVRDGPWKLLADPDGSRLELYNLVKDPKESRNVATQHPKVSKKLKKMVSDWYETIPHAN